VVLFILKINNFENFLKIFDLYLRAEANSLIIIHIFQLSTSKNTIIMKLLNFFKNLKLWIGYLLGICIKQLLSDIKIY
jgi:hypothetical protein